MGGLAHLYVVVGNVRCNINRKQIMRSDRAVENHCEKTNISIVMRKLDFFCLQIAKSQTSRDIKIVPSVPLLFTLCDQGSKRLEKCLSLEGFLEKSLKIKSALKSTGKSLKGLEKSLNSSIFCRT